MKLFKRKKVRFAYRREDNILDSDRFLSEEDKQRYCVQNEGWNSYTRRPFARGAYWAILFEIVGVIFSVIAYRISMELKGVADARVYAYALCAFLFSGAGTYYGVKSFRETGARMHLSVIAVIIGGVFFLLWLMIFLMGIRS